MNYTLTLAGLKVLRVLVGFGIQNNEVIISTSFGLYLVQTQSAQFSTFELAGTK